MPWFLFVWRYRRWLQNPARRKPFSVCVSLRDERQLEVALMDQLWWS